MALLVEDLRHAVRAVRQQRALSAVVLLTLALAIGANSAIFTVVNAVLLRALPYDDPDRVVILYMVDRAGRDNLLSVPDVEDLRPQLKTLTGLSPMATQTANLTGSGEPDRLRANFVGAEFFRTLGVQPIIGRGFAAGDDQPGAPKTAVLDYDVWQTRFGGNPGLRWTEADPQQRPSRGDWHSAATVRVSDCRKRRLAADHVVADSGSPARESLSDGVRTTRGRCVGRSGSGRVETGRGWARPGVSRHQCELVRAL